MKPEHIGQSLLAVVFGLAGYKYLTSNDNPEEPTKWTAPSEPVAPAPVAAAPPMPMPMPMPTVEADAFTCFSVHLDSGERVSECHATIAECQSRAAKSKGVVKHQGIVSECFTNAEAYVFATKNGPIETAELQAHVTLADCDLKRRIALKTAKADDVSPCMAFAKPSELR